MQSLGTITWHSANLTKYNRESHICSRLGFYRACFHQTRRDVQSKVVITQALRSNDRDKQKSDPACDETGGTKTGAVATAVVAVGVITLAALGYLMRDEVKAFLDLFTELVDQWGYGGYIAYIVVYAALELLAVPAIPLTMTAGAIFGVVPGTALVSIAATMACTGSFLIARYLARDRVLEFASKNPKFAAIDKAIGKDSFRVVTLLRLSPLLPLAASNYLYGLTSVELWPYVLGSWLGMLPGTFAYVAAGTYGKGLLTGEGMEGGGLEMWQIALAIGLTTLAVGYIGRLAKNAIDEVE